jgi:hypothetical protein
MSQQISLKEAERKVFKTSVDDGLWDILLGCYFLSFVVALYLSPALGDFWSSATMIPIWGFTLLVILLVRKYIVSPRMGIVKFGQMRKTKLRKFSVVMLVVNIIALILGAVAAVGVGILPGQVYSMIFGMIILICFSLAAYFLDINRFYIYGLLVGVAPLIGEWLWRNGYASHHGFPITFSSAAGIMTIVGLVIFVRLLRHNPLPSQDIPSEPA